MDRPSESFAKAATRKRFQELVQGRDEPSEEPMSGSARSQPQGTSEVTTPSRRKARAFSAGSLHIPKQLSFARSEIPLQDLPVSEDFRSVARSSVTGDNPAIPDHPPPAPDLSWLRPDEDVDTGSVREPSQHELPKEQPLDGNVADDDVVRYSPPIAHHWHDNGIQLPADSNLIYSAHVNEMFMDDQNIPAAAEVADMPYEHPIQVQDESLEEPNQMPVARPRRRKETTSLNSTVLPSAQSSFSQKDNTIRPAVQSAVVAFSESETDAEDDTIRLLKKFRKRRPQQQKTEAVKDTGSQSYELQSQTHEVTEVHSDRVNSTTQPGSSFRRASTQTVAETSLDGSHTQYSASNQGFRSEGERLHHENLTFITVNFTENDQPSEAQQVDIVEPLFALTVHRTDRLPSGNSIHSAVVRVSVMDGRTGNYLKKTKSSATFYYERDRRDLDYILPVMTQICDITRLSAVIPSWEETLLYNENIDRFRNDEDILLGFELSSFVPSGQRVVLPSSKSPQSTDSCFVPLAWAFYKLRNNTETFGKKRLQLYNLPKSSLLDKKFRRLPAVYQWYMSKRRLRYPATLYINIIEIESSAKMGPAVRSFFPNQPERPRKSYSRLKSLIGSQLNLGLAREGKATNQNSDLISASTPSLSTKRSFRSSVRLPNQRCLVPNSVHLEILAGQQGATIVKFSTSGRVLAVGCLDRPGVAFVQLNDVRSGIILGRLYGCQGIIYELDWNESDLRILAACADGTVKIWNTETYRHSALWTLPHPGFVYSARFHPKNSALIATGCYDGVIRIWSTDVLPSEVPELIAELLSHKGFINVVLFDKPGRHLYSGGSDGFAKLWKNDADNAEAQTKPEANWTPLREQSLQTSTPSGVTDMKLNSSNLLIAVTQDGYFYFLQCGSLEILRSICFSPPQRLRICLSLTPCGTQFYLPGNNSEILVFDAKSGLRLNSLPGLSSDLNVTDLDYHPTDHMLALCGLGPNGKVIVTKHVREGLPSDKLDPVLADPPMSIIPESPLEVVKLTKGSRLNELPPIDSKSDKIAEIIKKLNEITSDLQNREQARTQKLQNSLALPSESSTADPSSSMPKPDRGIYVPSPHTLLRQGILPGVVRPPSKGMMQNLSRI